MAKEPVDPPEAAHPRYTSILIGQQAAENRLRRSLSAGRMPHAWLLTGPRGIGKATLAYRLARHLLSGRSTETVAGLFGDADDRTPAFDVPEQSPVFRAVAARAHPNLLVIERSADEKTKRMRTEIGVEEVRPRLAPFFGSTAADGGWRVAIVDGADELNRHAANALLKCLEEPPIRGLLVLVAHAARAVLPTIRSRCVTLAMPPLGDRDVARVLADRLPGIPEAEVEQLTHLAQGRPGRAIELARAGGLELYRELLDTMASIPGKLDVPRLHGLGDRLNRRGNEDQFRLVADLLLDWLGTMIARGSARLAMREAVAGEREIAERLWQSRGLAQWVEVWEKVRYLVIRGEALNLDRKQILIDVFQNLDGAAVA
jgi:DNA polymerase-3 subunit delta'